MSEGPHVLRISIKGRGLVRVVPSCSIPTAPGSMVFDRELYVIDHVRWSVDGSEVGADVYLVGPVDDE